MRRTLDADRLEAYMAFARRMGQILDENFEGESQLRDAIKKAHGKLFDTLEGIAFRVHILMGGFPLCGFTHDVPRDWPAGQTFVVGPSEEKDATCPHCKAEIARMEGRAA